MDEIKTNLKNAIYLKASEKRSLKGFIHKSIKLYETNLESINLFGSSLYTKEHKDIDLVLFVKELPETEPISGQKRYKLVHNGYGRFVKNVQDIPLFENKITHEYIPLHYLVIQRDKIKPQEGFDLSNIFLDNLLKNSITLYPFFDYD